MLNRITMIAALVGDPELKELPRRADGEIAYLVEQRVACERPGKDAPTDYFTVKIWGSDAKVIAKYSRSGARIAIDGRLVLEQWGEPDNRQYKVVIVAEKTDPIDWPKKDSPEPASEAADETVAA